MLSLYLTEAALLLRALVEVAICFKYGMFHTRNELCELLLFGDTQLNVARNRKILEATISYIKNMKRFANTN